MGELKRLSKEWARKILIESGIDAGLAKREPELDEKGVIRRLKDGRKRFKETCLKPLHCHWFRHSRITWAAERGWSPSAITAYFDVSLQVAEKTYIHPAADTGNKALLATADLIKEDTKVEAYASNICPACGELNSRIAQSCKSCGSTALIPLKEGVKKQAGRISELEAKMNEFMKNQERFNELVAQGYKQAKPKR